MKGCPTYPQCLSCEPLCCPSTIPPPLAQEEEEDRVYIFAYGAMMASEVTIEKRQLKVVDAEPAIALYACLGFNTLENSTEEPSFAALNTLSSSKSNSEDSSNMLCAHGVLYTLQDSKELAKSKRFEQGYDLQAIDVVRYKASPHRVKAHYFHYLHPQTSSVQWPSERYRNLLIQGAKEHSLCPAYISFLESL